MKCEVVVQDEGWAVVYSLTNQTQDMNQIKGTGIYISSLPACTSNLLSDRF